ncbi:MAG: hypothetical protein IKE65_01785 [Clostridia bacterium]|nr:hypothetical protein [Clostridia bacterium]
MGAGGGFLLLYVPKYLHPTVKSALKGLEFVPFHFENAGAEIIGKDSFE